MVCHTLVMHSVSVWLRVWPESTTNLATPSSPELEPPDSSSLKQRPSRAGERQLKQRHRYDDPNRTSRRQKLDRCCVQGSLAQTFRRHSQPLLLRTAVTWLTLRRHGRANLLRDGKNTFSWPMTIQNEHGVHLFVRRFRENSEVTRSSEKPTARRSLADREEQ